MISLICAFLETKLVSVAAESELWGAYGRRMRREGDMSRIEIMGFGCVEKKKTVTFEMKHPGSTPGVTILKVFKKNRV